VVNIVYIIVLSIVITCAIIKEIKKMKNESIRKKNIEKGIRDFTVPDEESFYQKLKEWNRGYNKKFWGEYIADRLRDNNYIGLDIHLCHKVTVKVTGLIDYFRNF